MKNKKAVKIIILIFIVIILIFIFLRSNLITLLKLKIDLNSLNNKSGIFQSMNNSCIVGSYDGKKNIKITPSNIFEKTPSITYYNDVMINNGPLRLKVNDNTDSIFLYIGIDKNTVLQIYDSKKSSITYNNRAYVFHLPTIWQAIVAPKTAEFEIATPINSECFYHISISLDNYKDLKTEDLESLLNFQIIN